MKDIAIYGAGGLGREVACLIKTINETAEEPKWKLIGFFDDGKEAGTQVSLYGNNSSICSDRCGKCVDGWRNNKC